MHPVNCVKIMLAVVVTLFCAGSLQAQSQIVIQK
jgi:hypothetical protein